jgi:hypothetical protein
LIVVETTGKLELWGRTLKQPLRKFAIQAHEFSKAERKKWDQITLQLQSDFQNDLRLGACECCGESGSFRRQTHDGIICCDCERQFLMVCELHGKKAGNRFLSIKRGLVIGTRLVEKLEHSGTIHGVISGIGEVDVTGVIEHPGMNNLGKLSRVSLFAAVIYPHTTKEEHEPALLIGEALSDRLSWLLGIGFED